MVTPTGDWQEPVEARVLEIGDVVLGSDGGRMRVARWETMRDQVVLQLRCLPSCEAPHSHKPFVVMGTTRFRRESA